MNKIRICYFVCGLHGGGAEQVIYNYCSKMDKEKYEFYLVYQHEACEKNLIEFQKLNFKLFNIPSKSKHPFKNICSTYKIIKNNKFDVIHAHMNIMNFIPLICGKLNRVKIRISHSHTCDIRRKNILIKCFEFLCKRMSIIFSTDIVACGQKAGEYMYGNKKFKIIHNAIDLNKFSFKAEIRDKTRKELEIDKNIKLLGNVGRFTEAKNHLFLLDVFAEICNKNESFKLLLIGDGELRDNIKQRIQELKIQDKVIIINSVENVSKYYQAMDLFVMPSKWEGLPLVGIEAQASGLKCFFSDNISNEVIVGKNAYKKTIKNKNKWINDILQENYNYNRKINLNGTEFDILKETSELLKIYNRKEKIYEI